MSPRIAASGSHRRRPPGSAAGVGPSGGAGEGGFVLAITASPIAPRQRLRLAGWAAMVPVSGDRGDAFEVPFRCLGRKGRRRLTWRTPAPISREPIDQALMAGR